MFVNSVPFLVLVSRNINLITIEHTPKRTASKFGHLLQWIINVYSRAGLNIRTIIMENEFKPVHDHVPSVDINTTAAAEHAAEIEWHILMIKERCRGILCTLPYKALPQLMLIHLLHFVVMWLNNFPAATGISSTFSPQELILRTRLDYNKHCRSPFGAYYKTHRENNPTNSMLSRGTPSICLGPTGNLQGSYYFFSLVTGKVIKCCNWDELPIPQSVIDSVAHYAAKSSSLSVIVFADRHRNPYAWPEDTIAGSNKTQQSALYPDLPANIPGVHIARTSNTPFQPPQTSDEPD